MLPIDMDNTTTVLPNSFPCAEMPGQCGSFCRAMDVPTPPHETCSDFAARLVAFKRERTARFSIGDQTMKS